MNYFFSVFLLSALGFSSLLPFAFSSFLPGSPLEESELVPPDFLA